MILGILVGLSAVNLLTNLWCHLQVKKLVSNMALSGGNPPQPQQTMAQVEDDLNHRLRMLQTQQFGPRMNVPYVVRRELERDE